MHFFVGLNDEINQNIPAVKPVPSPEPVSIPIVNKSPINLVYEKFPDVTFTCESVDTENCNLRFKVICCIEGQNFEGFGELFFHLHVLF